MSQKHFSIKKRRQKLPGSVWDNNGYWYWSVKLPWTTARKAYPLCMPGSKQTIASTTSKDIAESAAWHAWEAAEHGRQPHASGRRQSLRRLAVEYMELMDQHYSRHTPDGKPSSQAGIVRLALGEMLDHHGDDYPNAVDGPALTGLVNTWIRRGLVRTTINRYLNIYTRFYGWLLAQGHIDAYVEAPVSRYPQLSTHSQARESEPVEPVDIRVVGELLPMLTPTLRDMVMCQYICDMRPGEVCMMTAGAIDCSDDELWIYEMDHHKTKRHGKLRVIPIFPEARQLLEPRMAIRQPKEPLFSAKESYLEHLAMKHGERQTPMNQGNRPRENPMIRAGDRYQPQAYSDRIRQRSEALALQKWIEAGHPARPSMPRAASPRRADRLAAIALWEKDHAEAWTKHVAYWQFTPNQLRHAKATENRAVAGREIAAVLLGHAKGSSVTDRYTRAAIRDEVRQKAKSELKEAARMLQQQQAVKAAQ